MAEKRLYDLAKVIRSKNSGPFSITLDALFSDAKVYYGIKKSGVITREEIAEIYQLKPQMITQLVFFDAALGFKITFDRKISSGTCLDTDVYGAQQHAPLGELMVPVEDEPEDG